MTLAKQAWQFLLLPCLIATALAHTPAGAAASRTVHFPPDRSLGRCYVVEKPAPENCWYHLALGWPNTGLIDPNGDVEVPTGKILRLDVWDRAGRGAEPFQTLGPEDVQFLNFFQYAQADDVTLAAIGRLTSIEVLFLGNGRFTREGLKYLPQLKRLEALQLPGPARPQDLAFIMQLPRLRYLNIGGPTLTDAALAPVGRLTSLTQLSVGGAPVGNGLFHLRNLKQLRYLNLQANPRPDLDKHLAHLADLTEMEELDIEDTLVGDAGLAHLVNMKKLKRLKLFINTPNDRITDEGMKYIGQLYALEEVYLPSGLSDEGIARLADLQALKRVNLWSSHITDRSMETVSGLQSLEHLDVSYGHVTDEGLGLLATGRGRLKSVGLQKLPVTDKGLAHLSQMTSLQSLHLETPRVTGGGLRAIQNLPALHSLSLWNLNFGPDGMAVLAPFTQVATLRVYTAALTDYDLEHLAAMQSLKTLRVGSFRNQDFDITDAGIAYLARIDGLETVYISGCSKITDAGIRPFENLTSLKYLRLGKARLTGNAIAHFKAARPQTDILVLP